MQSRMFVGGITAMEKIGQRRWFTGYSKTHACARKTRPRVVIEFDSQVILMIAELTKLETKLFLVRWSRDGTGPFITRGLGLFFVQVPGIFHAEHGTIFCNAFNNFLFVYHSHDCHHLMRLVSDLSLTQDQQKKLRQIMVPECGKLRKRSGSDLPYSFCMAAFFGIS